MPDDTPSISLVRRYIEAVQRARASGDVNDFEALREFLAADVVMKAAGPWTDEPWRVIHRGADAVIARLQAQINKSTSLTTENVTVRQAGDDEYVEQLSTIVDGDGTHASMVCHIFSVVDGVISGVRGYRNERGIPARRSLAIRYAATRVATLARPLAASPSPSAIVPMRAPSGVRLACRARPVRETVESRVGFVDLKASCSGVTGSTVRQGAGWTDHVDALDCGGFSVSRCARRGRSPGAPDDASKEKA